jgi:hypothetical protein
MHISLFHASTLLLLDDPIRTKDIKLRAMLPWSLHCHDFLNTVCSDMVHLHDRSLHLYLQRVLSPPLTDSNMTGGGYRRPGVEGALMRLVGKKVSSLKQSNQKGGVF